MQRLTRYREHIYRKHRVALCTNCWREQKDEAAIVPHIVDSKCVTQPRRDFSVGICMAQYNDLKSRKGLSSMTDIEKWERIFKIVCPAQADNIPSPCKADTSTPDSSFMLTGARLHKAGDTRGLHPITEQQPIFTRVNWVLPSPRSNI